MSFCCETQTGISHYLLPQHGLHRSTTWGYVKEIKSNKLSEDSNWKEKLALETWFWGCAWVQGSQGYKEAGWSTVSGLVNKQEVPVSTGLSCLYQLGSWVLNKASSPIQVFSALADGDIDHSGLSSSESLCIAYALECLRMKCLSWNVL